MASLRKNKINKDFTLNLKRDAISNQEHPKKRIIDIDYIEYFFTFEKNL
jgi:hypothetical protein